MTASKTITAVWMLTYKSRVGRSWSPMPTNAYVKYDDAAKAKQRLDEANEKFAEVGIKHPAYKDIELTWVVVY